MLHGLIRKGRQVIGDPALRGWMWRRALGLEPGPESFTPHRPPYLDFPASLFADKAPPPPQRVTRPTPRAPLVFHLHGRTVRVEPEAPDAMFDMDGDLEFKLGLHRFAWLPLVGQDVDPAWVSAVWEAWTTRYGERAEGWAWHPYTTAERAINLLDYAEQEGQTAPSDALLLRHAQVIAGNLEYFGERGTGNHLTNNGRGLYRLGLALRREDVTEMGRCILRQEAGRLYSPGGVLREGSSHYHLLTTRWMADVWRTARRQGRPEAAEFAALTGQALRALDDLVLPGGLPLIGDISPDCPPDFLGGLLPGGDPRLGWTARLREDERAEMLALKASSPPVDLAVAGWHRLLCGRFSLLVFASPTGWPPMPGHGHQDLGGFELHVGSERVFVDPGRGHYGEAGDAALYRSGQVHNTLLVDDQDPSPPNKPYYADTYRRKVGGTPPTVTRQDNTLSLTHHGFARLGAGSLTRSWTIDGNALTLRDRLTGGGVHRLTRRLFTPLAVEKDGTGLMLSSSTGRYRLSGGAAELRPATLWSAYGEGAAGTEIVFTERTALPWAGQLTLEAL